MHTLLNKLGEICADMFATTSADFYCFFETWIANSNDFEQFKFNYYINFGNCCPGKSGGGVLMLVTLRVRPVLTSFSRSISPSSGYNVCSIYLQNYSPQATLVTVYRPPNAIAEDATTLFSELTRVLGVIVLFNCGW